MTSSIVWFRRDLRLHDNPAWLAGARTNEVVPLFVIDPAIYAKVSGRRRSILVQALSRLDSELQSHGGHLRVEAGDPVKLIPRIVRDVGIHEVHVNREVTPSGVERDRKVSRMVNLIEHDGVTIHAIGSVMTKSGLPYRMFTPFHRTWSQLPVVSYATPRDPNVTTYQGTGVPSASDEVKAAEPDLMTALGRLDRGFDTRNRPDHSSTSRLSTGLKYGWIGPRHLAEQAQESTPGRAAMLRQLAWRDFYGHLMAEFPETAFLSMRPEFRSIPWRNNKNEIEAWKSGRTGYPFVDAAMRQLEAEGWIHNRGRMIAASFLTKDLLADWRIGERHFRHHLIDADVATNVGNWQWVAGTGVDSAPYFRVFNPVTQSRKFDPDGSYIRTWVPELAHLSPIDIHQPWDSDITPGDYPPPIVDHDMARERAIQAFSSASERFRQARADHTP